MCFSWVTHRQINFTLMRQLLMICLIRVYFYFQGRQKRIPRVKWVYIARILLTSGLQLRNSLHHNFHDYSFISCPNPIAWPPLESSQREWSHYRFWTRNEKWKKNEKIQFWMINWSPVTHNTVCLNKTVLTHAALVMTWGIFANTCIVYSDHTLLRSCLIRVYFICLCVAQ